MYAIMLSRRVFRCLVKTSLKLSLVCICGLSCLFPDVKTMKKFKESLACQLINFWNMLNQDGLLWLQLYCKLLKSLMVLNNTFSLMSVQNSLSLCITKCTKKSVIKSNAMQRYFGWDSLCCGSCWYIQLISVDPYITLRMCVTSFNSNGKISKVRGICKVGCKRVTCYQNCTS